MKQQRLITHVTGRGDELDPSLTGGSGEEGVWRYFADKTPNKCVCACLNVGGGWRGGSHLFQQDSPGGAVNNNHSGIAACMNHRKTQPFLFPLLPKLISRR